MLLHCNICWNHNRNFMLNPTPESDLVHYHTHLGVQCTFLGHKSLPVCSKLLLHIVSQILYIVGIGSFIEQLARRLQLEGLEWYFCQINSPWPALAPGFFRVWDEEEAGTAAEVVAYRIPPPLVASTANTQTNIDFQ